jgi:hypothetical protein
MGLIGEVERLNNTFLSEKHLKQKEREDKQQTQAALFNYFYKQFKKAPHDFEIIYTSLLYVNKREEIIGKMLVNNTATIQYINSIYTKTLREVYNIFKNNYKFLQSRELEEAPPEEDEPQKKQLNWAYFWQVLIMILLFPLFVILGAVAYDGKRKRR